MKISLLQFVQNHVHRLTKSAALAGAAALTGVAVAVPADAQVSSERPDGPSVTEERVSTEPLNPRVYRQAQAHGGTKIMVSVNERRLRLVAGRDTLLDVPVAVGMGRDFSYEGRSFRFETPTGRRTVRAKEESPVWTPPDWHYMEKAAARDLELVRLKPADTIELADGSHLIVQDGQVGRLNQFGNFWAITPGTEIVFDGKIFVPPFGTAQRRVPEALGPYKLDMGDGYLIHGTHLFNEDSIGEAVSHGCVRMNNHDLDRLYHIVDVGVPVFIY